MAMLIRGSVFCKSALDWAAMVPQLGQLISSFGTAVPQFLQFMLKVYCYWANSRWHFASLQESGIDLLGAHPKDQKRISPKAV